MVNVLLLIGGLVLVLVGANYLVDGATAVAKRFGLSDMIIGMTIVAAGTSAPEMVVSFIAAVQGNAAISVGNIVGSNICNILLILGISAAVFPIVLSRDNVLKEIPFVLLSAAVLCVLSMDGLINGTSPDSDALSLSDGIILLLFFAVFMVYSFLTAHKTEPLQDFGAEDIVSKAYGKSKSAWKRTWLPILMIIGGLCTLIWGGQIFVDAATKVAKMLGISDAVIAVTVIAIGTSVPELATSVIAAAKKNPGLALGNVVGSNIFNVFFILGVSATITPLSTASFSMINYIMLGLSSLLLFLTAFTFKRKTIDRAEGIIFLILYAGYIIMLI